MYETQLLSSNIPLTKKQIQYEHRWTDHPITVVDEVLHPARNDKNNETSIMWRHLRRNYCVRIINLILINQHEQR